MQTVAAGAEQMGASISEISRNAADVAGVAAGAVTAATRAAGEVNALVGRLRAAVDRFTV